MTIRAEVHTDNLAIEVEFDATAWFKQATDAQILALAECEFGGDYPADEVARFYDDSPLDQDKRIELLFDYLALKMGGEPCGFECHVNEEDALAWLLDNRPKLRAKVMEIVNGE